MTVLVVCATADLAADARQFSRGCLYAVTEGPNAIPVVPCTDADPLNLSGDPDIRKVMNALRIEPGKVRFKGCPSLRFSAGPDGMTKATDRRYLVTYPAEASQSYVAPITHELAHVLQMEMAGGLIPLRDAFTSKRVELGADYLTGLVFSNSLEGINVNQFQHNLSLMGLYVELDAEAHGTPSQRTAAFRRGVNQKFDALGRDMRRASDDFQANIYGHILQM